MKFNKLKGIAAVFILASIIMIFANDLKYTFGSMVIKVIGLCIFLYAISKDYKKNKA